ncbi:hypothetical protein [Mucilaginibacter sp.]|uniref:hypothetical protein n=1 Tax=Mucilaginibacter sp. TaxID=1882438 RepID=UPI0035BC2A94
MPVYKLTEQGAAGLKRSWVITMIIAYLAITAAFYYSLVYKSGDNKHLFIFVAVSIVLFVVVFFGRKKYFDGVDGSKLIIESNQLTLHALNVPDKVLAFNNIRKLNITKRGIELLSKRNQPRVIVIINEFEKLDEIERLLRKKISS